MSCIFVAVTKYLDPYQLKQRKIIMIYSYRGLVSIIVGIIGRQGGRSQKLRVHTTLHMHRLKKVN